MTELLDKNRIERLESVVRSLHERLAELERTVYVVEAEIRRLYEHGGAAQPA